VRDELKAVLAIAEEKLRAAQLLIAGKAWGDASSRAYYAAFHAVSAALLSRGETYSSHAQVLGAFNRRFVHRRFVHPGLFPKAFTAILTRLFEDRQIGDYDILPGVTEAEARQDVADAQRIIEAVRHFLPPSQARETDRGR
jgi:uncharacterized protein (UPF0332 family)